MKVPEWSPLQILFIFRFYLFIYYLAVLSLHCCIGFSLVVESGGCPLAVALGLLTVVGSLVVERGL